jgi:hypothetical protein
MCVTAPPKCEFKSVFPAGAIVDFMGGIRYPMNMGANNQFPPRMALHIECQKDIDA